MAIEQTTLNLPDEPIALRSAVRALLDNAPADGLRLIDDGDWIARPLWEEWGADLTRDGWDKDTFRQVVIDYRNELRLWVMGERPWAHAIDGLLGKLRRRTPVRC